MKRKIIGILVCTLLISATGIAIADWDVGEEFKMHHPQLPYPNGFDVDWGFGPLGDDWLCIETGNVDDIHFWISWFYDQPQDIPFILFLKGYVRLQARVDKDVLIRFIR